MCSESGKTIWPQYSTNSTNTFKSSKTKGESDDGTAFPIIKMISLTRITNHQCCARSNLKNTINVVSSQGRAFQISLGANLFSDSFALHRKYHGDTGREGDLGTIALSMKRRDFRLMSSIASGSSRKSDFRPTMMTGVPGQYWITSSNHCPPLDSFLWGRTLVGAFSSESGALMAKAINITWALL